MAIAHDIATTAASYAATGTQTTSHAASASAHAAVVLIHQVGTADQVSGVTYGGVEMTRLGHNTEATEAGGVYIYFLDGITGGTQNVAMTTSGTSAKRLVVATMTVAANKIVAIAGNGYATLASASSANPSWNITGLTPAVPVVAYEVIHSGLQSMTTTPPTNPAWTRITSNDIGSVGNGFAYIANTPAGTSLICGWLAGTADDWVGASIAFKEADPPPPVASFTASVTTISIGDSVTFTDTSTNNPTAWAWTFGGGTPASAATQGPHTVQFNTAGTYTVTLQATNAGGSNTTSPGTTITISAVVPVKIWNGTSFKADAKIWNGTSWRDDAKLWDGTEWLPFTISAAPPPPAEIPATGLLGWWAADDLVQADLSTVTSWPPHTVGPTFAAVSDPPVFRTNVLNGKPAVRFSATTSDVLLAGAGPWMRNVNGGMFFIVGNGVRVADDQTFLAINKNVLGSARFSLYVFGAGLDIGSRRLDADTYLDLTSTTLVTTTKVIRATRDWANATASIHVNGVATNINNLATGSAGPTSDTDSAGMHLGRDYSGQPLNGDIFEVIVYERVLDAGEIVQVEDYLSTKYGL